jgi:hypothetical protein
MRTIEDGLTIKGVADLNHDGALDLIAFDGKTPTIYLADGPWTFPQKERRDPRNGNARRSQPTLRGVSRSPPNFDNDGIAILSEWTEFSPGCCAARVAAIFFT